ncbi:MAG: xanthine dehydrogenase family protein molybdopterin-binding subunit [Acidimicrobiaceae bacterium]|nr:xanthine dehydrogenase family protein molybdopterin-binding subunit [Acidimicrobiaceae bacterium]MYF42218.1 xanthine dehydrogenase family protein molybdopterin-binding subunit [Acidimicrobiaceae bacterium]
MHALRIAGGSAMTAVPRSDAWEKVTGRARYAVDAVLPNMAHAAVVRSERAHARISAIDRAEAEAAPGVIAVVTAEDLGDLGRRFGHIVPDHAILAEGKVRYYGEPVAVVVAETPHQAADAAELVWVDYDDLPALTDAATALASDVLIHEQSYVEPGQKFLDVAPAASTDNVAHRNELAWGDAEAALATAATVVETTTTFPLVYGYAMETYNALADWQPGSLHVVSTAQHPLMVRRELARMFSLPLAAVRVEVPYIGGGYGSKSYTKLEPLAAAASWAAGRPVKVTTDVEAAMYTTRADGALVTVRTGFDADALICARDIDIRFDTGAYADNSPLVLTKSINRSFGPYRTPNLRVRGVAAYTNTSPASSYRGFGAPQAALAGELNMDMAADRLGIDPVELRRRNLLAPGDTIIEGKRPLDADLVADLDAIVSALDRHAAERDAEVQVTGGQHAAGRDADVQVTGARHAAEAGIRRGRAVAVTASDAGASPISTAQVRMHADGSVTLLVSSTEMGQGSRTALSQIAARELCVPIEAVAVGQSDTRFTPFEWTTGASRTTTVVGLAVQAACDDLWDNLRAKAADSAGVLVDEVVVHGGRLHLAADISNTVSGSGAGGDGVGEHGTGSGTGVAGALGAGERGTSAADAAPVVKDSGSGLAPGEVIRQWFGADAGEVVGVGVVRRDGATAVLPPFWEIGAVGVEVSVDVATGEVTVEQLVTVGDVGYAVNPDLVKGQDLGAATQGLGIALWEEMVYDGEQLTNPNLVEYRVPRLRDTPRRITSVLAERGDGAGPYGAKGAGEGALNPVPAAVAAAVGRAVGVWPTELPLTPPRVWSLLQQAQQ